MVASKEQKKDGDPGFPVCRAQRSPAVFAAHWVCRVPAGAPTNASPRRGRIRAATASGMPRRWWEHSGLATASRIHR